jgi:hypothetical protein
MTDDSTADKAVFAEAEARYPRLDANLMRSNRAFVAGAEWARASRDTEVAELRGQLAEAQATIEKVREASEKVFYLKTVHNGYTEEDYSRPLLEAEPIRRILSAPSSTGGKTNGE